MAAPRRISGTGLLACFLAMWLLGTWAAPAAAKWRFVVMGDSRGSGTGINEEILSELVHEVLRRDIDLVIFPGDLVYGGWTEPAQFEAQLWNWIGVMRPLYDAGVPVYVCRGNHEIGDMWYPEMFETPDPTDNFGQRWLHVFGSPKHPQLRLPDNGPRGEKYMSYSVVHKNAMIVALDQYAGEQYYPAHYVNQPWLDAQLRSNVQPHVFVFAHEPAFRTLRYDCLDAHPYRRDAFWNSLKTAGARTYFCCHDHYYDHARVDDGDGDPDNDIHQLIAATAGAPLYDWAPPYDGNNGDFTVEQVYHAAQWGYLLVTVDDLTVTITWMERQDDSPLSPVLYLAKHVWRYDVPPKKSPCPTKLAADLNGDCRVDFADLAILAAEWLAPDNPPNPPPNSHE
ncbi:MAG: hypothetical protein A2Y77_04740 [Planctomycetes bacterium RBG_13_62_9]|nr:MAG: hypothetical protein A2Y77_04740 [Planctomycetes bacterium RBG_13_62_9]